MRSQPSHPLTGKSLKMKIFLGGPFPHFRDIGTFSRYREHIVINIAVLKIRDNTVNGLIFDTNLIKYLTAS